MGTAFGPLADPDWLLGHLGEAGLRVIDLRWYSDARSGRDAYLTGHIPGASFVDLDAEITGTEGPGRHPLPGRAQFQAAMRAAGVGRASRVVVYDDQGGFSAARLWWLLRYFGHSAAAVLDGGLQAWRGALEKGPSPEATGDFVAADPDQRAIADLAQVRSSAAAVLVDARAGERFRGEVEPLDAKAGHIPGAVNLAWRSNLDESLRFLPAQELAARYRAVGVESGTEVIAYCGSGISACVDLLALEVAGLPGARLYPGSWSDWSSHDLPVAVGDR